LEWEGEDTVVDAAVDLRCTPEPEVKHSWEELADELEQENATGLVAAAIMLVIKVLRRVGRKKRREQAAR